jgi:two-component system NtrC family sensor kinase
MRLSYKLSLGVAGALTVALGIDAVVEVRRAVSVYEDDLLNDNARQARTLSLSVGKLWSAFGDAGAIEELDAANSAFRDVQAQWISLRSLLGSAALRLSQDEVRTLRSGFPIARFLDLGDSGRVATAFSPVVIERNVYGVVQVSQSANLRSSLITRNASRAVVKALLLLTLSWACATLLGMSWVGRPVALLADKARRTGKGDFGTPLALDTRDELALLAETLNAMCAELDAAQSRLQREVQGRLAAMDQVRRTDRLATVGRLAAGLAHEVGTPLNVVAERAKMVRAGEVAPDDMNRTHDIIIEQTERITKIMRQLLDFARQQPPQKTRLNLYTLLESTRELLLPIASKKSIEFRLEGVTVAPASVDGNQMRQVLVNLVMNAIQAMDRPGTITLRLRRSSDTGPRQNLAGVAVGPAGAGAERQLWSIDVVDQGSGISEADLARIFEPFFTTKGAGEGTGLGLSIVEGIVLEHGGSVSVVSKAGQGSTFTVSLPAEKEPLEVTT